MCEQFKEDYKEALEMVLDATEGKREMKMTRYPETRHLVAMHQALLKCREEKEELRERRNLALKKIEELQAELEISDILIKGREG